MLITLSTIVTFFIAEFAFRKVLFSNSESFASLKQPSYYSDYLKHRNEHFFNDNYWKLQYIFNPQKEVGFLHPKLGWTGYFDSETYLHNDVKKIIGRRPVLLYGNSFTMCMDTVKCFQEILNSDHEFADRHYLLNYSVGGYGLDQIYLLMDASAEKYNNPFVIFSMLTTDLDRSLLSFRLAPKPRLTSHKKVLSEILYTTFNL